MILLGTLVNAGAIILGALLGRMLKRIPESMRQTVMQGIALAVFILGIKMCLGSDNFLLVIISIVLGTVIGEWIGIEKGLNNLGHWLERKVGGAKAVSPLVLSRGRWCIVLEPWLYSVHWTVVCATTTKYCL